MFLMLLSLLACKDRNALTDSGDLDRIDNDADGFSEADGDCNDGVASINPGAGEGCDYLDNDCDGQVDEGLTVEWFLDADKDDYGDPETLAVSCEQPLNYIGRGGDCEDQDETVHPNAEELCDGVDQDCDGVVDNGALETWWPDADGDGTGDPASPIQGCEQPDETVDNDFDCDDTRADVNELAADVCDGVDNDCDGELDEDPELLWYADTDGDGAGNSDASVLSCDAPTGYVGQGAAFDCDDSSAEVGAGAEEVCDGVDNDCDEVVDEPDAVDAATWYSDVDGDGYGDPSSSQPACEQPSGTVGNALDCDDTDSSLSPETLWYADADGDGFGDPTSATASCTQPSGTVSDGTDSDDSDSSTYPGATEVCDGVDNDGDGEVDESDAADVSTWYLDYDSDGYGRSATTLQACDQPSGYVADSTDCVDTDADVNPGKLELCDGQDTDCDGSVDEDDAADADTWYLDGDSDGYGLVGSTTTSCDQPSGYVADSTDCDDGDASLNPGEVEICDTLDNDCDGSTDESDATDALTWYLDSDTDGYGRASTSTLSCSGPSGYVALDTDCDDTDISINPAATEYCDAVDNDCDGDVDEDDAADVSTWYADADSDGYGDSTVTSEACDQPTGYVSDNTDSNDANSETYPGATEVCDGEDNDGDGDTDESAIDALTWYADSDSDGYGDSSATQDACDAPTGYVSDDTDCDDTDAIVNPGEIEYCDLVDNDCNGTIDGSDSLDLITWHYDRDGDGYGRSDTSVDACDAPSDYVSDATDCDDDQVLVNPGATEVCDDLDVDEDCNTLSDDDDSGVTGLITWYIDADADGYGTSDTTSTACEEPSGYVADATDCDDTLLAVNPGATEVCGNGIDDDCDGGGGDCGLAAATLASTDATAVITGITNSGSFSYAGEHVVFLDDGDGDGFDELVVISEYNGGYYRGRAYIFDGSVSGSLDDEYDADVIVSGVANHASFGSDVWSSDANGDGLGDLLIGAPGDSSSTGAAYLFYGPVSNGSEADADISVWGANSSDNLGEGVSMGDVNGDGDIDLLIGGHGVSSYGGAAYLFLGPITADQTVGVDEDSTWDGAAAGDYAGSDVAVVPDTNGDGYDDLLMGASADDDMGVNSGTAMLVLGPASVGGTWGASTAQAYVRGGSSYDYLGGYVDSAQDFNGDGYGDFIIGAPNTSSTSYAAVFYGPVSGTLRGSNADLYIYSSTTGDAVGKDAAVGDIDADGTLDIVVGGIGKHDGIFGHARIFYGPVSGSQSIGDADTIISGPGASSSYFGGALALGDSDGDGVLDLAVGAQRDTSTSGSGATYLFMGSGM
ncbi:MAG: hypothetical protein ACI9VR_001923 [Cognaticolwellia sp.]|jgi:hypothetical protein